uniref:Ji4 putative gag protein n=1 Tax=Zea diploperennis TaxID=4576 RepID=I6M4X0_ZEADI|nr:Ji4 putative gag protein [Zea diploperennis]
MSGDHAKKEMETGEKPTTSHGSTSSEESRTKRKEKKKNSSKGKEKRSSSHHKEKKEKSSSHKTHRKGDKHKRMRKVVYCETDSSSPSTSDSDAPSVTSKRQERKKYSKIPLRYPRIPKHTPLLSVPLGKPPTFDGEDYAMWSNLMRFHLTSLHKSIWDVVEFGVQVPSVGDEDYDEDEVAQIEHSNSQATTILLASLSKEEYNKVQGLKSAKEIWDLLKTAHEGDELTKITKRETIEGELGRFRLRQGEEPQDMYNRLKTLVNQVRNLGSMKWDDHEVVKVILRSLIFLNPTQVQLIRGNPRYTLMTPEEVIGNFVSFECMIKGSKKINELDDPSTSEAQPVAFKTTEEKKEESTPSRQPIDASKLDNEEMALIIKSFRQILKQRKGKDYKSRSKKVCYKCGKPGHFIAKCPLSSDSDKDNDKKGKRREKKRYHKKRGGDAHVCREWDSDESSTESSSDEDAANIAVTKGLLFPNVGHKCLMAKDGKRKKVKSKSSTKYESSSDDNASDEEDNLRTLFANLNMEQKEKLNELVSAIHEKDDLLDTQEDFLIKENKKHVKVKNAYALEVEKCQKLSSELSTCHDTIANLRNENASLNAKVDSHVCDISIPNPRNNNDDLLARIEELNISLASLKIENEKLLAKAKDFDVCKATISDLRTKNDLLHAKVVELKSCKPSTSIVEHTSICTRCRDIDVNAIHDHMSLIKQQNDHIAKLDAKIAEHNLENEKFKFARSMLYNGRRPGIKDGIGFQRGDNVKLSAPPKRLSNFVKGKAPMPQDNEGYILYPAGYPEDKIRRIHSRKSHSGPKHAFMYKGETSSSRQPTRAKLPKKKTPNASNDHDISFKTFDASYVLTNKSGKVVAKFVGGKHKGSKTCVWVPKVLVSNAKGPKTVWVPKVKN